MSIIISLALIGILITIDQIIKLWAINSLAPVGTIKVFDGLLSLTYVENRGAAFGIFAGNKWILIGLTSIIILALLYLLFAKKLNTNFEKICLCLFVAGGIGNLIDRARIGYVVDYIDINQLFSYPMFNFADCCVVIGAVAAVLWTFYDESQKNKQSVKKDGELNEQNNPDSN